MNPFKKLRENKGVSQQEVAEYLGISRQAYNFYENEKREASYEMLLKLADYFGITVDYLLTGEQIDVKKDPRYIIEGESIFEKRVGFSGETKKYLTEDDLDDIATIIRAKAERNRQKATNHDNTGKDL